MKNTVLISLFVILLLVLNSMSLSAQSENKRYYNNSGREIAYIGNSSNDGGMIELRNRYGYKTTYIGQGYARFLDRWGDEVVYIGESSTGKGMVSVNGSNVHDYAEVFELIDRTKVVPGTVMSMADNGKGLRITSESYDLKVVGVVSGAGGLSPGMRIGTREDGTKDLPIVVSGMVYVRVCTEGGPVQVGDLLVSSSKPGIAMKAQERENAFGTVIGKALEPYIEESKTIEGLVRMLVMNR